MRIAVMVKKLNEESDKFTYTLVLPPWGPLYHWQTRSLGEQSKIPWKQFFDVASISRYVPALDYEDYVKRELFPIFYFEYFRNFSTLATIFYLVLKNAFIIYKAHKAYFD